MTRVYRSAFTFLVLLFCGLSADAVRAQDRSPRAENRRPQIAQEVRDRVQRNGRVRVIVELRLPTTTFQPEAAMPDGVSIAAQRLSIDQIGTSVLGKLRGGSFRLQRRYVTVPHLVLDVDAAAIAALQDDENVLSVVPDELLRPFLSESAPLVQADQAWPAGFDGRGTVIAVVDSGVDSTHPFLLGKVVHEACFSTTAAGVSQSVCPNGRDEQFGAGAAAPCPMPDCLHGTHVAGIAAGDGSGAGQSFSGVAKGAHVMAVQVFSTVTDAAACGGVAPCLGAYSSDIIAGLEHVYSMAGQYNIAAVNMSLGGSLFLQPCDTEPYKPIIDNLRAIGIATVVASGNSGLPFAISTPACVSSAISVGSTDKSDQVSWFSNVASFLSVFAPGENITSSVPGAAYEALSGTSMATPHVSGAWALLKQAVPNGSVRTILQALQQTGLPITDARLFGTITVPRIRIFQALASLIPVTSPSPVAASLSPTHIWAGAPSVTLTVNGSAFNAFSVVKWNGAARTTKVISSAKLEVSIPASDLGTTGTAQVTVFTPQPGGGSSSPLTFTIDPPPALSVSASTVAPRGSVTMTLANGLGGATDWLALATVGAANTSYIQWIYVGSGVTSRSWTVNVPSTGGPFEFRLFLNDGYTRIATSPPVAIDESFKPAPVVTSLSPTSAIAGAAPFTLSINGSGFTTSSVVRWNGSDRQTTFVGSTLLQASIAAADVASVTVASVSVFTSPPGGGTSASFPFTVKTAPSLAVSATTVAAGASVTVTLTNGLGGERDWLALAAVGSSDINYLQWTYLPANVANYTWTVNVPSTGGPWEFRLFTNGYTRIATSPSVSLVSTPPPVPPSLSVSATRVAPGGSVTVTLTNGLGGAMDWLALATTTAPNTSYIQWIYLQQGATTQTWTVAMPTTGGPFEFRLFLNNGYTRAATSPTITIDPSLSPPPPTLAVSASNIKAGNTVTVTLTNGLGNAYDWIALATTGAANGSYLQWTYVGAGVATKTWTVTIPSPGTYEFRLFLNNGYTRAATSPPVTVAP